MSAAFCTTTTAMAPSRMSQRGPVWRRTVGLRVRSGLITIMTAGSTSLYAVLATPANRRTSTVRTSKRARDPTAYPPSTRECAVGFFTTMVTERSGMGVDSADFNQDGWQDLFVTNVDHEMYSIYKNKQDQTFDDLTGPMGIGRVTRLMSGWGLKFFDYDNDGDIDLLVVNGHPDDNVERHLSHVMYKEPLLLFRNTGHAFENVSASA